MRIGMVGPTYPFRGGISHYTTLLFKELKKRHHVRFVSFKRQYPKFLFPGETDIDSSSMQIKEDGALPILDSLNPITWVRSVRKLLEFHPEIIIIPWWVSFWAPQFFIMSIIIKCFSTSKLLFICHNVVEHESRWIDKVLTRFVLSNGDYFIVHSENDKENLIKIVPDAIVKKTFHPSYIVFNTGKNKPELVKNKYNLKGDVILFFGFVREYKGLIYLLKALPAIIEQVDISLLVVGEFWKDKEKYLNLMRRLGIEERVILVDAYVPNEEIGNYFLAADLVVQPYLSATGSGIVQIAYGFGRPVIATNVGCLPEVVEDGRSGYIVQPASDSELSSAVIRFFKEFDRKQLSKFINDADYKFSWSRMVDVIESFLHKSI